MQKSRLRRLGVVLTLVALLWLLLAPQSGLFDLLEKRSVLNNLESETGAIALENRRLQAEIERLENDKEYLEEVARRDYDMLKSNEQVYDFSQPAQSKKK